MGKIVLLDDLTINKIAAGEVIERPASVVKEMVENSIDAGATQITVEIKNGGISYIRITDNGKGIAKDDLEIAFERHATSKIRNASDIDKIHSMGFRGEALASIAAVSTVELVSKTPEADVGNKIVVKAGNICEEMEMACKTGTSITVTDLFFNTPVRYKFLKKDFTEAGYVEDAVTRLSLVHPEIAFKFINSGKTIIQTSGNGDIQQVIYGIYGRDIAENILKVDYTYEDIKITGVIGKPEIARSNRSYQLFFVNKRFVKDRILSSALEKAFKELLTIGKYAFSILDVEMDPSKVDVNVHPAKLEVRFQDESKMFKAIYHAVNETLLKNDLVKNGEKNVENEHGYKANEWGKSQVSHNPLNSFFSKSIFEKKKSNVNPVEDVFRERLHEKFKLNDQKENTQKPDVQNLNGLNAQKLNDENADYKVTHGSNYEASNINEGNNLDKANSMNGFDKIGGYGDYKKENNSMHSSNNFDKNETIKATKEDPDILGKFMSLHSDIPKEYLGDTNEILEQLKKDDEEKKQEKLNKLNDVNTFGRQELNTSVNNLINENGANEKKANEDNVSKIENKEDFNDDKSSSDKILGTDEKINVENVDNVEYSRTDVEENDEKNFNDYKRSDDKISSIDEKINVENVEKVEKNEKNVENLRINVERNDENVEAMSTTNSSLFEDLPEDNFKLNYKLIGIIFKTYIIIEKDNQMFMIDQHAAHERVMFEKVRNNYYNGKESDSQLMLLPDIINLTHKEMELALENIDMFRKAGFIIDEFGENTIKISGTPSVCIDLNNKELFMETLDEIVSLSRTAKQEKENRFIATIACKSAVKAGMELSESEVKNLLTDLFNCENPYACAHGRPTIIKMSRYEIERKFERK